MNWVDKCDFLITRSLNWEKDTIIFEEDDDNSYELSWIDSVYLSIKKNNIWISGIHKRVLVANQEDKSKNGIYIIESDECAASFKKEEVKEETFVYVADMVFCFVDNNWCYAFTPRDSKEQKNELLEDIEETIGITMRDLIKTTSSIEKKAQKKLIINNENQDIWKSILKLTFVQEEILSILKILICKQ
jgi:SpoVK/Ycf46/Vps4 family AAA+-type ATPase